MDGKTRLSVWISVLGLVYLAATGAVLADSPGAPSAPCQVASPQEAKSLADTFYENREFQRAAECYEAAGDPSHAQLAYLKAVGPNSEAAARAVKEPRDATKALVAQVAQAFRRDH